MKKRFIISGVILIALYFFFQYLNNGTERKIEDKTIQYSEEIGWVNWGHAMAGATIKAFDEFKEKNKTAKDSFLFDYTQKMKLKIGEYSFIASYSETWEVKSKLKKEEEKKAFLGVFKSVSDGFENMQGEFPYSWIGGSVTSQREGDLTGNLISYLTATSEGWFNPDSLKLNLLDYESTLQKFYTEGLKKTKWDSLKFDKTNSNPLILKLQNVLSDTVGLYNNLIKLSDSDSFYFVE